MITLYGISNCDTIRKSGKWLDKQGLPWTLHDYRKHGLDHVLAEQLVATFPPEMLINKRGTTWRQLDSAQQNMINDPAQSAQLIIAFPAVIKRPIAHTRTRGWLIGYDELLTISD